MQGIWADFFRFFDESVFERKSVLKKLLLYRKKGARQNKFISKFVRRLAPAQLIRLSLELNKRTKIPINHCASQSFLLFSDGCSLFSSYLAFPRNSVLTCYNHIFRRNAPGILRDCHPWWLDGPASWGWSRNTSCGSWSSEYRRFHLPWGGGEDKLGYSFYKCSNHTRGLAV